MYLTTSHFISLIITLGAVTSLGLYAARKVKTAADFAVGGQASGVPLIAGTITGTILGGASTIGTAQLAFSVGFSAWWYTLGAGIALAILGLFYAGTLRSSGLQTIPEYLVVNYGKNAGPLCSVTSSIGIFFSLIANVLSAVPLVSAVLNVDAVFSALIVFLLVIVYVFFGGVWGTGLVGILKSVLIYVTLVTAGVIAYVLSGGLAGLQNNFSAYPWFSLFGRGTWIDIGSALSLIVGTLSTQTYIQAIYAAKDAKAAKRGALVSALITLPIGLPCIAIGMYMRLNHPDIAPIEALPLFILNYLPPWLGGIAIATLLLAAIGSAAGLALGVGTMLSRDIIGVYVKRCTDNMMLIINRLTVFVITLLAVIVTFGNMKSLVLDWNYLSMGLRGAGTFLPLTAAVFIPGMIRPFWALASMIVGAGAALLWKFFVPGGIEPLYPGLLSGFVLMIVGFIRQKTTKFNC